MFVSLLVVRLLMYMSTVNDSSIFSLREMLNVSCLPTIKEVIAKDGNEKFNVCESLGSEIAYVPV